MSINTLANDRSGPTFISQQPAFLRDQGSPSIDAAISRYVSAAESASAGDGAAGGVLFGGGEGKDYRAIAQALLARLDAMRDRATQWRAGTFESHAGSTSAAPANAGDWWKSYSAAHSQSTTTTPTTAPTYSSPAPTPSAPSTIPPTSLTPATASGSSVGGVSPLADPAFLDGHGFIFNDRSGASLSGASVDGTDYGVVVDNQQTSENVSIDGFTARNVQRYGMYLGSVRNWSLNNLTLQQGDGASEHGLRIADGDRVTLSNSSIDTTRGHKSSMWLINVNDVLVSNTTFSGGAIRIGARPNDNQGSPDATNVVIRDSVINKVTGGDAEAIQIWPGSDHIHLANLDITLETSDNWLSIDSRNVGNITWENIRVNGRLITGFEGVKLGGITPEEAAARGIGPASA